jgi:hypothetical protein
LSKLPWRKFLNAIRKFTYDIFRYRTPVESSPKNLVDLVEGARQEMLFTRELFDKVTDSQVVEQVVYRLKAAECKYSLLLLQVKEQEKGRITDKAI